MEQKNKEYVLITGATSGIGYELAKIFAANNFNLIIVARSQSELLTVSSEFSEKYEIEVIPLAKDLFKKDSPFEIYNEIESKNLEVGILINNAAQGVYGKFVDTDIHDELNVIQLNINAYVVLTKLFLKKMIQKNHGRILNVASIAGKIPGPYQAIYHASKAFVHSFTEAIRAETADTGVTITSLLPGATDTDFFHKAHMESSKILEHELADPAKVAADGYNALMEGDDMVISGLKNKVQVALSNVTPDSIVAKNALKQQEPRDSQS